MIDGWLRGDLDTPKKQRHTAKRIFDRLLAEHDAQGVVSYGMVRDYVATRRREIRTEAGREPVNTFIPQTHLPGREAEVDFGEVVVRLRGELVTCTLFSLRLSYSGKAVHRISASAGQEAFLRMSRPRLPSPRRRADGEDPLRQPQSRHRQCDWVLPPAGWKPNPTAAAELLNHEG
ncbi:hypothetical protein [Nonomuraea sp. 10N515B]|uniref:hypothetical protein n=1 Tax=Nonomuraea sp. 10N515B TaxID=3457422 RepID=UPI003FCE48E3